MKMSNSPDLLSYERVIWPTDESGKHLELLWVFSELDERRVIGVIELDLEAPATWKDLDDYRRRHEND